MTEATASILVVDDLTNLRNELKRALTVSGYHVFTAGDGLEALTMLETHAVDLIIADVEMPHMNGYQLYEKVRENPSWLMIPFMFLTGRNFDSDIRYGKELGVDDYLTKPLELEDLLASVRGKLRRVRQLAEYQSKITPPVSSSNIDVGVITIGALEINTRQHHVRLHGQEIKLSAREFVLLTYLAQRNDQVTSPPELIKVTHDYETDTIEAGNLLRPLIRSLRRKLGYKTGEMGCIENIRGVGYRLIEA